jgi:hypothetical protein
LEGVAGLFGRAMVKVIRDESGNVLYDALGNITTDSSRGKRADEYNCDDFESQPQAQTFFEKVGGVGNDVNRLDGDKDGEPCESFSQGEVFLNKSGNFIVLTSLNAVISPGFSRRRSFGRWKYVADCVCTQKAD